MIFSSTSSEQMDYDPRPTVLIDLPVELLLLISEFLSPPDISCLALCNHGLMAIFTVGDIYSLNCRLPVGYPGDMANERSILLARLSIDLPQYYLCCACLRLHLWQTVAPSSKFKPPQCFQSLDEEHRWLKEPLRIQHYPSYSNYQLHWSHIQLAMRRFYHGPRYGITTDSLFYTEVRVSRLPSAETPPTHQHSAKTAEEQFQSDNMTSVVSFEARICPTLPSLCLRVQNLAVVTRQNASMLLPERSSVWICGHIGTYQSRFSDLIKAHINAYCSGVPRQGEFGRCQRCNTAYNVEMREFGTQDLSLAITRWIDVGPGLTPDDPRWRSHLLYESQHEVDSHDLVDDPRLRFENSPVDERSKNVVSDEELYLRNVSFLEHKRHKAAMEKMPESSAVAMRSDTRRRRSSSCVVM